MDAGSIPAASTICKTNNPPLAGYLFSGGDPEFVVPAVGIELTTYRLQGGCSTN
jgi:hypothetical protein